MRTRTAKTLLGCVLCAVLAGTIGGALPVAAGDRVVIVRPGDTLGGIALRVGVPVEELASINHLADLDRITVGQTLRVEPSAPARTHAVAYGETLSGIAVSYGVTVDALVRANGIANPSYLQAGLTLVIPASADTGATRAGKPAPPTHRVAPGETLWSIAQRYGTTVDALARLNGIANPGLIRAGELLLVPDAPSTTVRGTRLPISGLPPAMAAAAARHRGVGRMIAREAERQGVPVSLALALAWQESGWQRGLVSSAGAVGVMQLLPATTDWIASGILGQRLDPRRTSDNVRAGVALLRFYLDRYGDRALALAAYYQGMTAVDRHGIYPVSRPYVDSITYLEPLFRG